jgi:predicted RNA-binding protein with PIN domain
LPPAIFEDSPEATLHLLRVPRMLLLVDGYNVSIEAWPGRPISDQRRHLVDALAGLSARTGVEAQVVFDGAEQAEPRAVGAPPRSAVRVRFSPPDVDADEVLIELIDLLPPDRPVTVATSDRRVQDAARQRGANVISTAQLLRAITGRGGAPS